MDVGAHPVQAGLHDDGWQGAGPDVAGGPLDGAVP